MKEENVPFQTVLFHFKSRGGWQSQQNGGSVAVPILTALKPTVEVRTFRLRGKGNKMIEDTFPISQKAISPFFTHLLLSLVMTAAIAEVAALVPLGVQETGWEKHKAPPTGTAARLSTGATQEVSMLLEYQHSNNHRSWLNTTGAPLCFPPSSHAIVQPFQ